MSKRLVKVQEFDRSTLIDIYLDGFTSGLTTAAAHAGHMSGDEADAYADRIALAIKADPAQMEMVRREVLERVTGMLDQNAGTRTLKIDLGGDGR